MVVNLHSREIYRGVTVTIERSDAPDLTHAPFVAHVPPPGDGYIARYFVTAHAAMQAARELIDARKADPPAVDATVAGMVDDVAAVICSLIRTICMGDPALYRPMLERCAQQLGDV